MSNKIFEIYPHNFNKDKLKIEFKDSNPQEFMESMGKWRRSYKVGEYGNYLKDYYSNYFQNSESKGGLLSVIPPDVSFTGLLATDFKTYS